VKVPCDEGVAIHIGPKSCAVAREGLGEALTGERIGQPSSRERVLSWVPTPCIWWKATHPSASSRAPDDPAWSKTLACADAPCAGTGRSRDRPFGNRRRSASGRRGAVAGDARSREVRLCHSSWEADEQSGPDRSGAGGAKGGGQGECEPAKHAPDSEPGKRVTRAGAHTANRNEKRFAVTHTQGGSRMPELGPYGSVRGALSNERPYRDSLRVLRILTRSGHRPDRNPATQQAPDLILANPLCCPRSPG
jgi:hypothetical protein